MFTATLPAAWAFASRLFLWIAAISGRFGFSFAAADSVENRAGHQRLPQNKSGLKGPHSKGPQAALQTSLSLS
jgi:hypothetical protein